jgi:hypothetical protein
MAAADSERVVPKAAELFASFPKQQQQQQQRKEGGNYSLAKGIKALQNGYKGLSLETHLNQGKGPFSGSS